MLRTRDIVAMLMAVWLVQMAWNDEQDFLSASIHLAFYTHRDGSATCQVFAPIDVDGDGTVEALIVATEQQQNAWQLELLDLKPLHKRSTMGMAPFQPKAILKSEPIASSSSGPTDAVPLRLKTGQIMLQSASFQRKIVTLSAHEQTDFTDQTRHYFCGSDWNDAAAHCHKPCPGGTASECDGDHRCYADTPCDSLAVSTPEVDESEWQLTPMGGMPAVVSLWSDGTVRLHALTAKKEEGSNRVPQQLQLREMWQQSLVTEATPKALESFDLVFLSAEEVSTQDDLGKHGMIVVGSTDSASSSTMQSFDAMTGEPIWNSHDGLSSSSSNGGSNVTEALQKQQRGSKSFGRRRSKIVSPLAPNVDLSDIALPNCWHSYRHSLLEGALPFGYWAPSDASWRAVHLDRTKPKSSKSRKQAKHKWHHRHHKKRGPIFGRPNVLLSHTKDGLQVRSIKNGKAVCHLSLIDHVLYADLNNDGTLDQLQVVTNEVTDDHGNEWINNLAKNIMPQEFSGGESNKRREIAKRINTPHRLCHVLALSGLPAREEIFASQVCGPTFTRDQADHPSVELHSAPPLVVDHPKVMGDVVIPMSNGVVSKYNIPTGKKVWEVNGAYLNENFPTWGGDDIPLTAHVQVQRARPFVTRPILLAGENGMAIMATGNGALMASTVFPQPSQGRPFLADLTGDGTTDVIVRTNDAIWGYQIVVRTGASPLFRIVVGLLLMFVALALMRNRFGQRSNKRSTDE